MIETKNITKAMGEKLILRGVNLTIDKGESVAILGANGAGKSTWLKIVAGLMKPTGGTVILDGLERKKDRYEDQLKLGYLGHQSFLYDNLTPAENLRYYAKLYGLKKPEERIDELIQRVDLRFFKNEPLRSFSRGMVQRIAIARAILHRPPVLLLDEPHTGLDQEAKQWFKEMLQELHNDGVTIVMVTHEFDQMIDVCDRAAVIRKGKIAEDEKIERGNLTRVHSLYDIEAVAK